MDKTNASRYVAAVPKRLKKRPPKNQVIQDIVNAVTAEAMPPVKKLIEEPVDKMFSTEPANFEEVVAEINGDLAALQDYLKNSVFMPQALLRTATKNWSAFVIDLKIWKITTGSG